MANGLNHSPIIVRLLLAVAVAWGAFGGQPTLAYGVPQLVPASPTEPLAGMHAEVAQYAYAHQDWLNAKRHFEQAVRLNPTNTEALLALVQINEKLGLHYAALKTIDALLALQPRVDAFWYEKALLLERLNQVELAAESLESAISYAPKQGAYYYDLGVYYAKLGRFDVSAKASLQAIELDYNQPDAYNNYGYALVHLGELDKANEALDEALKLQPKALAATLDSKGYLCYRKNQFKEAIVWYNKALAQDAELAEVYWHKAQALEGLKQWKQAIETYQLFIKISQPSDEIALAIKRIEALKALL
jgi:tetratricopeptide (TPR) repeat protein